MDRKTPKVCMSKREREDTQRVIEKQRERVIKNLIEEERERETIKV